MPNELVAQAGTILSSPAVTIFGGFLAGAYSDTAKNIAGLAGGNHLKLWCMQQWDTLAETAEEKRKSKGAEKIELSPAIGIPLLDAATMETREELLKLWTDLLCAAISKNKAAQVRQSFIDIIKRMDPLDALILDYMRSFPGPYSPSMRAAFAGRFVRSEDDVEVSLLHFIDLGLAYNAQNHSSRIDIRELGLTATAKELLRVLS